MRSAAEHALQKSPPTAAQVAHIKERRPPDLLMLCASKALARTRGGRTKGRHGNCKMCDKPRSAQRAKRPPHTTQTKKSAGAALVWHISLLAMPEPRPLFLIWWTEGKLFKGSWAPKIAFWNERVNGAQRSYTSEWEMQFGANLSAETWCKKLLFEMNERTERSVVSERMKNAILLNR